MDRKERIKTDPVYAAEYHRKARERTRRRISDPVLYTEIKRRRTEMAAAKKPKKLPLPEQKRCTVCGENKLATSDNFSPRKDGRYKLASGCKSCHAKAAVDKRNANEDERLKHIAAVSKCFINKYRGDDEFRAAYLGKNGLRLKAAYAIKKFDSAFLEKRREYAREWYQLNPEKVKAKKHNSPAFRAFYAMRRYAAQVKATPSWANKMAMVAVYADAKRMKDETGIDYHVDHIIPIISKFVCGLHVEFNLRIITADENKQKSNKLIQELASPTST